jgi:hypothetical protein
LTAAPYRRHLDRTSHPEPPLRRSRGVHNSRTIQHSRPARNSRQASVYFLAALFIACELAGMAAVVRAYLIAQTTSSNTSEFAWFWVGMLLIELPIAVLIARRAMSRTMRGALLTLYGIVSYAPKLLRNPALPIFHDEFAHWLETYKILSTGKLFQSNSIVPIIARYPGLHATTAALVHATGLTIWQAAIVLLIIFHVTLVLGIAALAQALGFDNRTASFIAILYALNSSFLYFDTQYAYESMAITLVVWTLVAFVRAIRSQSGQGRPAWSVLTVVLSAGTVVTHHLSSFTLVMIMALVSLILSLPWLAREEDWIPNAATAWILTLVTASLAGAWYYFVAPDTWSYLSPYMGEGFSELMQTVSGSGGTRQLFEASLSPWWEQKSAYLATVFALFLAVGGLLLVRAWIRHGRLPQGCRRALLSAFAVLGLLYFPSTIFILSSAGAEGARRSWAFIWIGLSMLVGPAAVWLLDWTQRSMYWWRRVSFRSVLVAVLAIALIGGTAAGMNASYRFPGPFLYGSDTRSVTPELLAASEWFSARFGTNNSIVTDRYTGLIFGSFGLQNTASPSAGFPIYNLYLAKPGAPIEPAFLLYDLSSSDHTYLIVDARMAYDTPELGVYFTPNDPSSVLPRGTKSPFYGKLNKFNTVQWAVKVFQSDNYSIYRFIQSTISYQQQPPTSRGKRGKVLQGKLTVTP